MKVQEVVEKFNLEFVQSCSRNNVHISKDGKAACNSRFRVFSIGKDYEWVSCTACYKQLEKLGCTEPQNLVQD